MGALAPERNGGSGSVRSSQRGDGADGERTKSGEAARLDRLVAQAKAVVLWEAAWPILWRSLALVLAFLAASWAGLWLDIPPLWRKVGLGLFAAGFVATLIPLLRLSRPGRSAALARIDREAAGRGPIFAHGPASAAEDCSPSARPMRAAAPCGTCTGLGPRGPSPRSRSGHPGRGWFAAIPTRCAPR